VPRPARAGPDRELPEAARLLDEAAAARAAART
jgi:hypothetical protein